MMIYRSDARHRRYAGTGQGRDERRFKKGGGSAAPTPDPVALTAAQGAANKEAVLESAKVSQINEITPFGTSRYVGDIGDPSRTRITELPEDQQALVDLQRRLGLTLGGPAMSRALEIGEQPSFNLEGLRELPGTEDLEGAAQPVEDATFGRIMGMVRPQLDRARHDMTNDLTVRGLPVGGEAWNRSLEEFGEREDETSLKAAQEAVRSGRAEQSRLFGIASADRQQGISDRLLERSQPINEISAYMQGTPAMPLPNFGPTANYAVAPPDIISAYGLQQNAGNANANRSAGGQQAAMGAIAGLGGAAITAF